VAGINININSEFRIPFSGPAILGEVVNSKFGEPVWHQTLYNNVLDHGNNADLELMLIGDISEEYQNSSLFQRAKYT
jgi:hypothetical protein